MVVSNNEVIQKGLQVAKSIPNIILEYLKSDSPGGQEVIQAFMDEFEALSFRSPKDDPTNIKFHLDFIKEHITRTWDNSLTLDSDGNISIGVGAQDILGFRENKAKLRHNPTEVMWVVYLIRGIAGRYAFVNPAMYQQKKGKPMPAKYYGGFLIGEWLWELEGWGRVLGPFSGYEHPASGAAPIPFFENVMKRVNISSIMDRAIKEGIKSGIST